MSKVRVAFNGMGRIGKNVMRVIVEQFNDQIEIVAGNDLVSPEVIAQGLPKDSIFGRFPVEVSLEGDNVIKVGDTPIDMREGITSRCGKTVGVLTGVGTEDELYKSGASCVIDSVMDLEYMEA